MNTVISRIADFMGAVLAEIRAHHASLRQVQQLQQQIIEGQSHMSATLDSIKAKLVEQGQRIDQLVAERAAANQATLDAIDAAIDANEAKFTDALAPAATVG